MAKCRQPTILPDNYADIDNSTSDGMKESEELMFVIVSRNGKDWKDCRDNQVALVQWINDLPEPK